MGFLTNLQQQPEEVKKRILWAIAIVIGIGLIMLWGWSVGQKAQNLDGEEIINQMDLTNDR